jgi:hypothetical protein
LLIEKQKIDPHPPFSYPAAVENFFMNLTCRLILFKKRFWIQQRRESSHPITHSYLLSCSSTALRKKFAFVVNPLIRTNRGWRISMPNSAGLAMMAGVQDPREV